MPAHAALAPRERMLALAGVLISLLLAGLDQTIVATAGPAIQRDLHIAPSVYAWITTAYLVASTVMVPIYGKLSDRIGRKPVLLTGIVTFLLGSALCGLAPTALLLVAARAVQGLGAASLFTTAFAVIADLYPPAERARYMGLISSVFGIASVAGPLAGGYITDTFGWHWVFFINLPIGAAALFVVMRFMPRLGGTPRGSRPPLDIAGAALLVTAVVPLLLAFSLGRTGGAGTAADGYPWLSWQVLSMFAVAIACGIAFVWHERRAADPVLHLELFDNRIIRLGSATVFVLGASFLFAVVFLPLYLVNVVGISATGAGLTMVPLTLGVVAGSILSGHIASRIGHYKQLLIGALLLLGAGFLFMGLTLNPESTQADITLRMVIIGLGLGPTMPLYTLAMQGAATPAQTGVVTATATFSRAMGQVIGVALFGSLFATVLAHGVGRENRVVHDALPADVREVVRGATSGAGNVAVGEEGGSLVAFDTTVIKQRVRTALAVGASLDAAPKPSAAAALAAVDELAAGFRRSFTRAIAVLYLVAIGMVVVALAITAIMPELRLAHGDPETTAAMLE